MSTARAIVFDRYGAPHEVLRLAEVDPPRPGPGEVLVRVRAASVNPVEWHLVRGEPFLLRLASGLGRPKDSKVGADVAGVVEAVGPDVIQLAPQDAVFGLAAGSFAELACARVSRLARKPEAITFEQAASIPIAGCTALQALRDHGRLEAGQRVLVIGAAGGVGSFAVQIAKALGADVTGVCSTANVEFVRTLGADGVVDYARQEKATGRFDVVLQLAGDTPLGALGRLLTPHGTLVVAGAGAGRSRSRKAGLVGPLAKMLVARVASRRSGRRVTTFLAKVRTADLQTIAQFVEDGRVRPAVGRIYPLEEAAAALAQIESGHTRGKLVIGVR